MSTDDTAPGRDPEMAALFGSGGPLARAFDGYRVRDAQIEMASQILRAVRSRTSVVVEAGTGVGKTAAYLVPALVEGGKVIVSTGTKTLQDQLYHRDLPAIRDALAIPVQTALLKGRANYVCHWHLERSEQQGLLASKQEARDLREVRRFIHASRSGDKAECATVPEDAPIWARVTSTRDNCLGGECPKLAECYLVKARAQAQDADVVVVNHHLFFADLMLREEGVSGLLPSAQTIILDEAHQLPDVATQFFGETVSTHQLLEFVRDTLAEGLSQARDAANWNDVLQPLERAARDLRLALPATMQKIAATQLDAQDGFFPALSKLRAALADVTELLSSQAERGPGLAQLHRRAVDITQRLAAWNAPERADQPELCWIDVLTGSLQLHRTPISIAEVFRRQRDPALQAQDASADAAQPPPARPQSWIFTSATLSVRGDFSHFTRELGLDDAAARSWPSPFDYPKQAVLCVPEHLPMPQDAGHIDAVVDAALPLIRASAGRAFLLCTTLRAVERAAARLRAAFEAAGDPYPVLQQGEASRGRLLERFRQLGNAVLVGSHSFWEGIDVRGEALSLVVIDKLPFAPPDDPVLKKRLELLAQGGGQPFMDYQVPQAIIALKQGAGRLIRGETDRGVLMIGDVRLLTKPYGRRIWQSLPPMRRTRSLDDAAEFLRSLRAGSGEAA